MSFPFRQLQQFLSELDGITIGKGYDGKASSWSLHYFRTDVSIQEMSQGEWIRIKIGHRIRDFKAPPISHYHRRRKIDILEVASFFREALEEMPIYRSFVSVEETVSRMGLLVASSELHNLGFTFTVRYNNRPFYISSDLYGPETGEVYVTTYDEEDEIYNGLDVPLQIPIQEGQLIAAFNKLRKSPPHSVDWHKEGF